jgi:crotonobetainyl-CoA:carnitine CoA-transferase CaiB-like acyl-CoA transferase
MATSFMGSPLAGITVLDLTHMLSGPYGAMMLSDLGATTIKVEPPVSGEATRRLLADHPDYSRNGMGAYFMTLNRGKQSICIDLKTELGLQVFYDLVRHADIVFDNFAAGVPTRLKIDHDTLSAINPRIITCSITGFGETGPDKQRPAFDQVVQAMGGGMSITGNADQGPMRAGIPIGDLSGGIFAVIGLLAALQARHSTGQGQHVDVSMLDTQISLMTYMATMHLMSGHVPERIGNTHFVHVPYNAYPTKDGHIIIACIGDAFFDRFRKVITRPELQQPEFIDQATRYAAREMIDKVINEELLQHPSQYWLDKFQAARIPCGPVNDFEQALNDPQVRARNMVVSVPMDDGSQIEMPGLPIKFSGSNEPCFNAPPSLGRDTQMILEGTLGYSREHIASLLGNKVVQ